MSVAKEATTKKKNTRKKKQPIALSIRDVHTSQLKTDKLVITKTTDALASVMKWGKLTKNQACLFAYYASLSMEDDDFLQFTDYSQELNLDNSDVAYLLPDLDYLLMNGYFALRYDFKPTKGEASFYTQFYLPETIEHAILYNEKFEPFKDYQNNSTDTLTFLYRCKMEGVCYRRGYYKNLINAFYKSNKFLMNLLDMERNKKLGAQISPDPLMQVFVSIGVDLIDNPSVSAKEKLFNIFGSNAALIATELTTFKSGENFFIKDGIFEIDKANLGDDIKIKWNKAFKEDLFSGDKSILSGKDVSTDTVGKISCEKIKEKELFYNDSNIKDVAKLESIFDDDRYNEIRKRLDEKAMPKGVISLLYGGPGTGKTETVMQLARKSGRDILHVNIQEIRSCWVGESEKNVKGIFENYRNYRSEKKPILLFNEADAIVSTRTKDVSGSNSAVNKMENAMQNIILEELETFDGLLVMTTNLQSTLDPAFERRILFKLKFDNPTRDVKKKIWKSKIESLTEDELEKVANFEFSGGQIENVRRKIVIDEVLDGTRPTIESILDYCKKENLQSETSHRMGFCTEDD